MGLALHRTTKLRVPRADLSDVVKYSPAEWVHTPDMSSVAGLDDDLWLIDGDLPRPKTTAELNAEVSYWIAKRKGELYTAVNDYGTAHYSERTEQRLWDRLAEASRLGLTNRMAHIQSAIDWSDGVIADWFVRDATLTAAVTYAAVMAVSLDFSSHDATDPLITVSSALKVAN